MRPPATDHWQVRIWQRALLGAPLALSLLATSACQSQGPAPTSTSGAAPAATASPEPPTSEPSVAASPTPPESVTPEPVETQEISTGTLSISPTSGPVGTVIHIVGGHFPVSVVVTLQCGGVLNAAGEIAGGGWAPVRTDAGTDFAFDWPIASELQPLQGVGGGAVTVGAGCAFSLNPPYTNAPFTVTAPSAPVPTGTLRVDPTSGPVGTHVTVIGSGFPRSVDVAFYCVLPAASAGGSVSVLGWAPVQYDAGVDFTLDWIVPTELEAKQGQGGGPTQPSRCQFELYPPYAGAFFQITP